MDRRLTLAPSLNLLQTHVPPSHSHHSSSIAASPLPSYHYGAVFADLTTLFKHTNTFLLFKMFSSDSDSTAEGFLSKSSPSVAATRRRRRVVLRKHKQLLTKHHTKSCSRGRHPKPTSSHPPPSRKMDPTKSNQGASSSSSTPSRRLDGDINREAGMPLTGQDIVGKDNKARGVNCSAHGSISVIGRRREMEDRLTVAPSDFPATHDFFGVYDGDGGARVSSACRDHLHRFIGERIERWMNGRDEWERVMKDCFRKMDNEMNAEGELGGRLRMGGELSKPPKVMIDGSTALVVVLSKEEIVVANCGDSRAVLFRNETIIPLSSDQKPDRTDERRRVEEVGGKVIDLKPYMISEPEVTVSKTTELDNFLIIASDGLWDVVSSEYACEIVKKCFERQTRRGLKGESTKSPAVAAAMLAEFAMARGSKDNISVIVVKFKNKTP